MINNLYTDMQVRLDAGSYLYNTNTGTINVTGSSAVYGYGAGGEHRHQLWQSSRRPERRRHCRRATDRRRICHQ
jgi:hypothetical protein